MEIFFTCLVTVVSGVLVYIFSRSYEEHYVIPVRNYYKIRQKIKFDILFYANLYSNPLQLADKNSERILNKYDAASEEIRKDASELSSIIPSLPRCVCVSNKEELEECVKYLIGISNSFYKAYNVDEYDELKYNIESRRKIEKILKID